MTQTQRTIRRRAFFILSAGLALLLGHAFIPIDRFILRSDDAYYYFGVAANFPTLGLWSFDSIHSTNGVQPLWAAILSGLAQVLSMFGVEDRVILARVFVGLAGTLHFIASMMLFSLLSRVVSTGVAIAAAGAFLFPIGMVWSRVGGMENSLYGLVLISTISYFHLRFSVRPTFRAAVILGILLGLTAISRLNAGLLIPCLLVYLVMRKSGHPLRNRLQWAAVAGFVAGIILLAVLAANYAATDHILPISGAVKTVTTGEYLRDHHIDSRLSLEFARQIFDDYKGKVRWFFTSRVVDGLWILGSRLLFRGDSGIGVKLFAGICAVLLIVPFCLGEPRRWVAVLRDRLGRLSVFSYVLVFAVLNAGVSVYLYPTQLSYAMLRWWLVESEIVIIVLCATLAASLVLFVAQRFVPRRAHVTIASFALGVLVVFGMGESATYYWGKPGPCHDWNCSWNDESHQAAKWLAANVPADAVIGSWNAGVLGYHARQPVVNLDGLINNFELLPFLERGDVSEYILKEGITHLSDMDSIVQRRIGDRLRLTEVYRHYCPLIDEHYRVWKVEGRSRPTESPEDFDL